MLDQNKLWICRPKKGSFSGYMPLAIIKLQYGEQVEYVRFTNYGLIEWEQKVTMTLDEFLYYYRMITEEEMQIIKRKLNGKGGLEIWLDEKYPDPEP